MSLRSQINLLITVVMLLFVAALAYFEVDAARKSIKEEMEAATKVTVHLLTNVVQNERRVDGQVPPRVLVDFLAHLGRVRAHQITLKDAADNVLYTSPPPVYKAGRAAPAWYVRLVAPETKPITLAVGPGKLTIAPDASRSVIDAWDDMVNLLKLSLGLFLIVNVLVFWFAGRALHPVRDIVQGLRRMEQGDFHARLPPFRLPEMAAVSDTFNRMAQAVEDGFAVKREAERVQHELQENRALTQLIQHHIEEERRNLALELHDELGQSVTAVKTIAASLVNRSRGKYPEIQSAAQMIVDVSSQMYDAMHGMVRQLRPMALEKLGLRDALQELVQSQRSRHSEIEFDLRVEGDLAALDENTNITAYRVVQECLTNIVRHAGATRAQVHVTRDQRELAISISDNGKGFAQDGEDREERYGLLGMRERVEGLGGRFELSNGPGRGASVRVSLPVKHEALAS
jgi:two-component system, NarL family, sensor histidine kinase UhpB